MAKRIVDNLRMCEKELHAIISRYEHATNGKPPETLRRSRRWDWHSVSIVVSRHNEFGEKTHFAAYARNLSQDGLAFIHGAFIHPGSTCTVTLRTLKGKPLAVEAVVRRCSHIKGHLHDVGVQFTRQIDPRAFIEFGDTTAINIESVDVARLKGTILYVEDNLADQKLFGHYLKASSLDILYSSSVATGVEMLAEDPDLIFTDFRLTDGDGLDLIREVRDRDYDRPIFLITAESDTDVRMSAMAAGAKGVLRKPYSPSLLQCAVAEALSGAADSLGDYGPIVCDVARAGMGRAMLEEYVQMVRQYAKDLLAANEEGDADQVYELAKQIRGSAQSYGFPTLTEVAAKLMDQMGTGHELRWATATVLKLISACRRACLPPEQATDAA